MENYKQITSTRKLTSDDYDDDKDGDDDDDDNNNNNNNHEVRELQKTAILSTANILRRVLT
jgi:hypothetical protein